MSAADNPQAEPVSWNVDGIDIHATLTRPDGDGPFPAVIMVAGSGPTDRDWNTPLIPGTNGSAALLARDLTGMGLITLRYDKVASGPQAKENVLHMVGKISMQSHIDELAGGVGFLADRKDVDGSHIFALTNSEGAIHALNYQTQAARPLFAGLILTAPPGEPIGLVARRQIAGQLAALPGGAELLSEYDQAIANFSAGRPVNVDAISLEMLRMVIGSVTDPVNQPFSRELWFLDPSSLLRKVTAPVLVVIGKKDIQVDWQTDGSIFEAAAKDQSNISVFYADDANHVLKYEAKPRSELTPAEVMSTYNAENTKLDENIVGIIISWIKEHLQP